MSTNYYAFGPFPGGDEEGEGLHIGKIAAGWVFLGRHGLRSSLEAHPGWAERYLVGAEGYEFSRQEFC